MAPTRSFGTEVSGNSRPGKNYSLETCAAINALQQAGHTHAEIVAQTGVPRSTVSRIIKRKKETGLNTERPRSGRPPKLSRAENTRIVRTARKNPRLSLQAVAVEAGLEISTFTVRTTLAAKGIHSRIARRRPGLKPEHKRERLEFAKKILEFSDISRIVFSDETSIVRGNGNGQVRVLRRKEEEYHPDFITPTTKSRCVVMAWGAIAFGKKSEIIPMVRDEMSAKKDSLPNLTWMSLKMV
jgi:transposase